MLQVKLFITRNTIGDQNQHSWLIVNKNITMTIMQQIKVEPFQSVSENTSKLVTHHSVSARLSEPLLRSPGSSISQPPVSPHTRRPSMDGEIFAAEPLPPVLLATGPELSCGVNGEVEGQCLLSALVSNVSCDFMLILNVYDAFFYVLCYY